MSPDKLPTLAAEDEQICSAFERQWEAIARGETGERPGIEAALALCPEGRRAEVLPHLLLIELRYRLRMGEDPDRTEYLPRFPGHDALITTVFDRASMTAPPPPSGAPGASTLPVLPAEFPGYEVIEELGRGGMGVVYKARETATGRLVAIKEVRPEHADHERLQRFRREAQVMQQLSHRHIVPLLAVGGDEARPFLVMALVTGGSLEAQRGERRAPRDAAAFVKKLADAVSVVHDKGIVHRDLKPLNVLLDEQGEPLVSDFGLARLLDVEARMTASGAQMGTPAFMAPEQAAGQISRIAPATDVHALGLILYELLTGERAFDASTVAGALKKVEQLEPPPPRSPDGDVPRDLQTICLHCLHKDPDRRYKSAKELADDLGRFLARRKIVARPIGMSEKAVKWSRRHRVIAALGIAALCLALVTSAASWWYWDHYHRPKVALFASYVNRRGVPEGRNPLTAAQARQRWLSYRLTSRGGRVERMELIDGLGRLSAETSQQAALEREGGRGAAVCRYEYRRKENGELDEEQAYDRDGNLLWVLHYVSPTNAHYRNAKGYPRSRTGSGAAYLELDWNDRGYQAAIHFRDRSGNPHPDDEGVYGVRYETDDAGFVVRETFLDSSNQPTQNRSRRYATVVTKRDEAGNVVEGTLFDVYDRPAVGSDGYHRYAAEYDAVANQTAVAYFDAEGKPAFAKPRAIHRSETRYDERGFSLEFRYLDGGGKPTVTSEGYARHVITRDENGYAVAFAYFDEKDRPTAANGGYARETIERDERGRIVGWRVWDADGKPVVSEGYHRKARRLDESGRMVETAFFDAADRPTLTADGYAILRKSYDASGNVVEESYFGTDGKPISLKAGYAGIRYEYDDRDNRISTRYVDGDGKAVFGERGYARQRKKYDENGKEQESAYFGPDDRPVIESRLGIHRLTVVHDARGNPIETTTYGVDRKLVVTKKGFARMRLRYDEHDVLAGYECFDAADQPVAASDGVAQQVFVNDAFGQMVEGRCYGADGKPVMNGAGGFHRATFRYDARGKQIAVEAFGTDGKPTWNTKLGFSSMKTTVRYGPMTEEDVAVFDVEGKPALSAEGAHRVVKVTDPQDHPVEVRYYGLDGKPCVSIHGYARATMSHDNRGKPVEMLTFDADDKPVLTPEGAARVTKRHDERGNVVEVAYFGVKGEPVCSKEKRVHRTEAKYDALNRPVEERYFGTDGKPAIAVQGYARITYLHDERGNVVEEAHYGLDDKLILTAGGFAVAKKTYDDRGNVTAVRVFDKEGRPGVMLQFGAHEVRREFDAQGRYVAESYFGPDGKPVNGVKNYASLRRKLDDFGNVVEETLFDVKGKALRSTKSRFDAAGNPLELAGYGPAGEPTEVDGVWKGASKYDVRGNEVEFAIFDAAGKPAVNQAGVHRTVWTYNALNQRVRIAVFGPDGKPCLAKQGVSVVESRYDDRGHLRETEFFGTDGKPVAVGGACKLVTRRDERDRPLWEEHYGIDGKPCLGPEGSFRTTYKHNPRGHTDEIRYFGVDGKPILNAEGYATLEQEFSEDMRRTSRAYSDAAGKPVVMSKGYARTTQKLDEIGNVVEERYFGADDLPIAVGGFARVTKAYNGHGKVVAEAWFDVKDRPVAGKDGYASYKSECDELGRVLRQSYFGPDGKPVPDRRGVCSWTATYDPRGARVGERFFGPDGKPCLTKGGSAGYDITLGENGKKAEEVHYAVDGKPFMKAKFDERGRMTEQELYRNATRPPGPADVTRLAPVVRRRFDGKGLLIEEAYFDEQMRPTLNPKGVARVTVTAREDEDGAAREERYFGTDDKPVALREGGVYRVVKRYTPRGVEVGAELYGKDDKPAVHPDGYSSWRAKVDEQGRAVEVAYFGPDGKPATHKDGYARATTRYDSRGNRVEGRFFGADGKPTANKAGIAAYRTRYDEAGRVTAERYLGPDEKPAIQRELGYARSSRTYDERGNEVEAEFYGVDGMPVTGADGYARCVRKFDRKGAFVSQTFTDAEGKEVTTEVVIGAVVPGSAAERLGLAAGDVLLKYDGKPIASTFQLQALRGKVPSGELTVRRHGKTFAVSAAGGVLGIRMKDVAARNKGADE
jgi:tRNA A-37 threonylcarbamoyl transferase component Bud32/CTP:molybdopterin cytidylyltransferase MocA